MSDAPSSDLRWYAPRLSGICLMLAGAVACADPAAPDLATRVTTTLVIDGEAADLSTVGDGVWILVAKDGKPIPDDEGRFALISRLDAHTGPRHVRWLKTISVHQLPAP
jgi:hypothetical protein